MGAAAGPDRSGHPGYAMLLAAGAGSAYAPAYTFTWAQALALGAGTNPYDPGLPQIPVTLSLRLSGRGAISGSARCGPPSLSCSSTATVGVALSLQATPASGWTFAGWTGPCSGTGACAVTPTGALAVTAVFAALRAKILALVVHRASRSLTVRVAGPPGAAFSCSLVRRASPRVPFPKARYIRCASTRTYRHLKRGSYRFSVRARGAGSASRSFRIF